MARKKSTLTPTQERLLGYLAARALPKGEVACSKKELAEAMQCNVKTVDRAVMRLKALELIEVVPRYRDNGGQLGNSYRVVNKTE